MKIRIFTSLFVIFHLTFSVPLSALAQDTGPTESTGTTESTGPSEPTGAPECTGASCHQGEGQGENQGLTQGFDQGTTQGVDQNLDISNTNTGESSDNSTSVSTDVDTSTSTSNTANDSTTLDGSAATGSNTNSQNSGDAGITSGSANIGVTQVKSDNTSVNGGDVLFSNTAHQGDINGDLVIDPGSASSLQDSDGNVQSIQATNRSTGSNSDNTITVDTSVSNVNEVQNDGTIENAITALATTGDNHADQNTGDALIATGDANVSASLVNLLNTTVENGNILIVTEDVYGDVTGNIRIPDFNQLATILTGSGTTEIDASNTNTGANSTNTIDLTKTTSDTTIVDSEATVDTTITASVITGGNDSLENTGESSIDTGDANVQGGNVTVANTTVEDASLGIVIINALNRFVGFLIGSDNVATPLSEEETLTYVNATNEDTGVNSDTSISVSDERSTTTTVTNDATITNTVDATASTGNNSTNNNTGTGKITTGDATVTATAVNVANTTVKNGNLAVYIINIFGNFFGEVLFGDTHLALPYDTSVDVTADNSNTGPDSTNEITVNVTRNEDTTLNNSTTVRTTFDTTLDTGNNRASRNTSGANITTGESNLNLFSRTVANTVALGNTGGISDVTLHSANDTTGADSENHITVNVTDNFSAAIDNFASVETFVPGSANTGNNELNQNTIGGTITTGLIDFGVHIGNILNRVFLALSGADTNVAATSENHLTGSTSDNTNSLTFTRNWLLTIFNEATVDSIIDLLLNTGGNTANQNTLAAAITTGPICGEVNVSNDANTVSGGWSGSATIDNIASASTNGSVTATTGGNTLAQNTVGTTTASNQNCPPPPTPVPSPSPSASPTPSPTPGPSSGGGNEGGGGNENGGGGNGQGGGEVGSGSGEEKIARAEERPEEQHRVPRIAGAVRRALGGVGGLGYGWIPSGSSPLGAQSFPFLPFVAGSVLAVASAAWADRRARIQSKSNSLL